MKPDYLDKLFDDAIDRVKNPGQSGDPYGLGPLASDHFLLSRSWAYFKDRVKTIDGQYKQIIESKEKRIHSLMKTIESFRVKLKGLKEANQEYENLEDQMVRVRTHDHVDFQKDHRVLTESWQEERVVLEEKIQSLEFDLEQSRKDREEFEKIYREREKTLIQERDDLQSQMADLQSKSLEMEKEYQGEVLKKMEEGSGHLSKIDLMRNEIERRDQLFKNLKHENADLAQKINDQENSELDLKKKGVEQTKEIENLNEKLDLLQKDRDNLRRGWQEEQAQWRELWDRQREMWDRKKEEG